MLEADQIGDEEECALRDHHPVVHPKTLQPETRGVLLRHFSVTERRECERKTIPGAHREEEAELDVFSIQPG